MVNKSLFSSTRLNQANTTNEAGGSAYSLTDEHILCQYAVTGCFNGTYYVDASSHLNTILEVAKKCSPELIAKVAVYARKKAYMKDMPAFFVALLLDKDKNLFRKIFHIVIDDGKMLRNFAQFVLSRKVCSQHTLEAYSVRNQIQKWFDDRNVDAIWLASIGNDPSLADIIRLAHIKPNTEEKDALFKYILGYDKEKVAYFEKLPEKVVSYEKFKQTLEGDLPNVSFQLLEGLNIGEKGWTSIAKNATWTQTKNKLNNFNRAGVFKNSDMVDLIAQKIGDPELVRKSKVFPYQLLIAYLNTEDVPAKLRNALQDAMEVSLENVPTIKGKVYIAVDVSGSMASPATGNRGSVTSKARCVDVAALFAAAILRSNPEAEVIPFNGAPVSVKLNPRDSVMTNANTLAKLCGGGTNCSSVLSKLNRANARGDVVIYVSDNESWMDRHFYSHGTGVMNEWQVFKKSNKNAKLICIDITPNKTAQTELRSDILQVGGFGDSVFDIVSQFTTESWSQDHWLSTIKKTEL